MIKQRDHYSADFKSKAAIAPIKGQQTINQIASINQVRSTGITHVRLRRGFAYPAAVTDWYSRYALAWAVSLSLEGSSLRERLGVRLAASKARHLQFGSRRSVHGRGLYRKTVATGGWGQPGWAPAGTGQYLRRAALARRQVWRDLLKRLPQCAGRDLRLESLLRVQ